MGGQIIDRRTERQRMRGENEGMKEGKEGGRIRVFEKTFNWHVDRINGGGESINLVREGLMSSSCLGWEHQGDKHRGLKWVVLRSQEANVAPAEKEGDWDRWLQCVLCRPLTGAAWPPGPAGGNASPSGFPGKISTVSELQMFD